MVRPIRILTYPLYVVGVAFEIVGVFLQLPDDYVRGDVNINVVTEDGLEADDER